jgi:lipopolysaccharide transport system permease protein
LIVKDRKPVVHQPPLTTELSQESTLPAEALDKSTSQTVSSDESGDSGAQNLHITVIEPPTGRVRLNLGELWRYRDLLALLIWRDVSARYRQSIIGYGWAIIKPVLSMIIFTVIFGWFAKMPSDGAPYAIFSFAALMPWMYFSGALSSVTNSVVGAGSLLTKVYFPRLILPLTGVVVGLAEMAIQGVILGLLMVWYRFVPGWQIALVPLWVLMCVVTALAFGLWLTALNVKNRDVGMAVPFFLQAWMYLCPIIYPSSVIPDKWPLAGVDIPIRILYGLNPMVGVIEGFRWSILGMAPPDWTMISVSFAVVTAIFVGGLYYFRTVEATFADVI